MNSLKDKARQHESKAKVKNISELKEVNVDVEVKEEYDVEFPYSYIEVGNERYKVPTSVLGSLKVILEESPKLTRFKVKKSGEGMETRYTVIPLV